MSLAAFCPAAFCLAACHHRTCLNMFYQSTLIFASKPKSFTGLDSGITRKCQTRLNSCLLVSKPKSFTGLGSEGSRKCQTRLNSPILVSKPKSFTGVGSGSYEDFSLV